MGKSHHFFQRRNVTMILNFGRDDTRCNFLVFINAGVKSLCTISREQQFWYIRGAEGESQNVKSSHTDPWSRLFETHCSRRWAIRKPVAKWARVVWYSSNRSEKHYSTTIVTPKEPWFFVPRERGLGLKGVVEKPLRGCLLCKPENPIPTPKDTARTLNIQPQRLHERAYCSCKKRSRQRVARFRVYSGKFTHRLGAKKYGSFSVLLIFWHKFTSRNSQRKKKIFTTSF